MSRHVANPLPRHTWQQREAPVQRLRERLSARAAHHARLQARAVGAPRKAADTAPVHASAAATAGGCIPLLWPSWLCRPRLPQCAPHAATTRRARLGAGGLPAGATARAVQPRVEVDWLSGEGGLRPHVGASRRQPQAQPPRQGWRHRRRQERQGVGPVQRKQAPAFSSNGKKPVVVGDVGAGKRETCSMSECCRAVASQQARACW